MGIGLLPAPGVDVLALWAQQLYMLKQIGAVYGITFSDEWGKRIIGAFVGGLTPRAIHLHLISLIQGIPVVGPFSTLLALPVTCGASTYALGTLFIRHFESGGTLATFDPNNKQGEFDQYYAEGKTLAANQRKGEKKPDSPSDSDSAAAATATGTTIIGTAAAAATATGTTAPEATAPEATPTDTTPTGTTTPETTPTETTPTGEDTAVQTEIPTPETDQVLQFDGVNDSVEIPANASPTHAVSVEAWAKSGVNNWPSHGSIYSKRNAFILTPAPGGTEMRFYIHSDGHWRRASASPDIDITEWHHYVGSFDGETMRLYVDGVAVASTPHTGTITADDGPGYIGHDDGFQDRFFHGSISEVRIWDRALTPEQILTNKNKRLAGNEEGLTGYWPLAEIGDNGRTPDLAGNHPGTVRGATATAPDLPPHPQQVQPQVVDSPEKEHEFEAGSEIIDRAIVDTASNLSMVDVAHPMPTAGRLTEWEIWAESTNPIQLVIYRRTGTAWSVVGASDLETPAVGQNTFALDTSIEVQEGDFIGWYYPQTGVISFDMQGPGVLGNLSGTVLWVSGAQRTRFDNSSNRTYSIRVFGELIDDDAQPAAPEEQNEYEAGNEIIDRAIVDTASNLSMVDVAQPIPAAGRLTEWEIWAERALPIQLVIYRRTGTAWSVVGASNSETPAVGRNAFALARPIDVQQGDFIGWYYPQTGVISFDMQGPGVLGNLSGTVLWASGARGTRFNNSSNRTYSIQVSGELIEEEEQPAAPVEQHRFRAGRAIIDRELVDSARNLSMVDVMRPIPAAGQVTKWEIWAKSALPIQLVIYRRTGAAWSVVGASGLETPAVGRNEFSLDTPIEVQEGDFIGWYFPRRGVIGYRKRGSWSLGDLSGTVLWARGAQGTGFRNSGNRNYSIRVSGLSPSSPS
ncbi:LamG-like jellyroll fold domain-containing protein [Candidatus Entotheonella palauensis]|uniref:LamG-like jellyroll fold domain-containing protein n=1 Tax=Candidatus Entotheonella gemina TaxID=1429439 RepID=W4MDI6_9BACT|nr:MAG: hypothetical protein ETSY2_09660 [Candidatus Entotheonella gemina]